MALAHIFMNEALRPWFCSGLTHLLGSGDPQQPPFFAPAPQPGALPPSRPVAGATKQTTTRPHHKPPVPPPAPVPSSKPTPPTQTAGPTEPQWQELTKRIDRRSLAVWTYWELGQDLLGEASETRRCFLRQLIQTMRLPKGNIAFWPLAVLHKGQMHGNVHWFWRGVSRYGAEQVFCFGEPATALLDAEEGRKAWNLLAPSVTVLRLPAVDELAQMPGIRFMDHLLELMQAHKAL